MFPFASYDVFDLIFFTLQGLALLTLSWDKNWYSHSLVNGYPSFYPRIALVTPSPEGNIKSMRSVSIGKIDGNYWHGFYGQNNQYNHARLLAVIPVSAANSQEGFESSLYKLKLVLLYIYLLFFKVKLFLTNIQSFMSRGISNFAFCPSIEIFLTRVHYGVNP